MKTIIYWAIYCGGFMGSCHYATEQAAIKAAKMYSNLSGREWRVRMIVGTVAD